MNCKNCRAELPEISDYCYTCGGKVIRNRLTIKNLFNYFIETFFNYDNKFLQTFLDLFRKPEMVIKTYIDGTRKRYVDVISYFALAITLSGLQLFILNKFFPDAMDMSAWARKGTEEFQNNILSFTKEYQSIIMMMYVPLYAIISRIVFYNKKSYNYTEQLVIYMYIQAQISIASAFVITGLVAIGLDFGLLGLLMFPAMIAYSAYCLKRLYQLSFGELILKTFLFLFVFFIVAVLFTIALMALMFFNGGFDQIIEAERAAQSVK